MENKRFIILLFIISTVISLTCCKGIYTLERNTQKGKGINISKNKNISVRFYTNPGIVQDHEYIYNTERQSSRVTIWYDFSKNIEDYLSIFKDYSIQKESNSLFLYIDIYEIKKIEIKRAILHNKNKSINFRNLIKAYGNKIFDDDELLLLNNYGIIDIENNKNIEHRIGPDIILCYGDMDINLKRKFNIEIDMTFETEDGKKEDITLNLKIKRKIIFKKFEIDGLSLSQYIGVLIFRWFLRLGN